MNVITAPTADNSWWLECLNFFGGSGIAIILAATITFFGVTWTLRNNAKLQRDAFKEQADLQTEILHHQIRIEKEKAAATIRGVATSAFMEIEDIYVWLKRSRSTDSNGNHPLSVFGADVEAERARDVTYAIALAEAISIKDYYQLPENIVGEIKKMTQNLSYIAFFGLLATQDDKFETIALEFRNEESNIEEKIDDIIDKLEIIRGKLQEISNSFYKEEIVEDKNT